jgi:hypothetical protein
MMQRYTLSGYQRLALTPKLTVTNQQRFFAQIYPRMSRSVSLTDCFATLDVDKDSLSYNLQLNYKSPTHNFTSEMTLSDIESCLLKTGEAKEKVEFFAPDGARYSSSAQLKHITQMPFFRLNLDTNKTEFHIHSMKAFGEPLAHLNSSEK